MYWKQSEAQIQWLRETCECSQQESNSSPAGFQSLHVICAHCIIIMLLFNLHVFWFHNIWRSYLVEKGVQYMYVMSFAGNFFKLPVTYSCTICTLLCQLVIFNNLHVFFLVWAFEGPMYTYMCCSGKECMWCHEFAPEICQTSFSFVPHDGNRF